MKQTTQAKSVNPKSINSVDGPFIHFSKNNQNDVQCDGTQSCANGTTCCKGPNSAYRCCSFPEASCCSDGFHCCPSGFTCDSAKRACQKNFETIPIQLKKPAKSSPQVRFKKGCLSKMVKPDIKNCTRGTYFCGDACCLITPGVYSCWMQFVANIISIVVQIIQYALLREGLVILSPVNRLALGNANLKARDKVSFFLPTYFVYKVSMPRKNIFNLSKYL